MGQSKRNAGSNKGIKRYRFVFLPLYLIVCVYWLYMANSNSFMSDYNLKKLLSVVIYACIAAIIYLMVRLEKPNMADYAINIALVCLLPVIPLLYVMSNAGGEEILFGTIVVVYAVAFIVFSLPHILYFKKRKGLFLKSRQTVKK